jgi:hypothetical protein
MTDDSDIAPKKIKKRLLKPIILENLNVENNKLSKEIASLTPDTERVTSDTNDKRLPVPKPKPRQLRKLINEEGKPSKITENKFKTSTKVEVDTLNDRLWVEMINCQK